MTEIQQHCKNDDCTDCRWESSQQNHCVECGHLFFPEGLRQNEFDYIFCHECFQELDQFSYRERLKMEGRIDRNCKHEETLWICLACSKPSKLISDCQISRTTRYHDNYQAEVCVTCKHPVYTCNECERVKIEIDGLFVGRGVAICPPCHSNTAVGEQL